MKSPTAVVPNRSRRQVTNPTRSLSPFGSLSSFRALTELENEMDRWMQNSLPISDFAAAYDFAPACDLTETTKEFVIQFDIPGIKKDDVKIEIENNRLTVTGERSDKKEQEDAKSFLSETSYGSFMRSFALPTAVDENKVDAHYDSGVLTIKVPKLQTSKAKAVKIQ